MFRKIFLGMALATTVFAGSLSAGTAYMPQWYPNSTVFVVSMALISGQNECTVTYYDASGSVAATSSHTFTTIYAKHSFAVPASSQGLAIIECEAMAIASGQFNNGVVANYLPINNGLPF